jgi:hypothetical protein
MARYMRRMVRAGTLYESFERRNNLSAESLLQMAPGTGAVVLGAELRTPRAVKGWWCPAPSLSQNAPSKQSRAYVDPSSHYKFFTKRRF